MIRRPPRSTQSRSSAASDVYKRQGVVDERHAIHCSDVLQSVRQPVEVPHSPANDIWRYPIQKGCQSCAHGIRYIVPPPDAQVCLSEQLHHACRVFENNATIDNMRAGIYAVTQSEIERGRTQHRAKRSQRGVIPVEYNSVIRRHVLEQTLLHGEVVFHGTVAVKMVRNQVRENSHSGMERMNCLELEAADLKNRRSCQRVFHQEL